MQSTASAPRDAPAPASPRRRRLIVALVLLTIALSAAVRFADLAAYPQCVADENYYARDASWLLHNGFGTSGVEPWMPGLAQSFAHPELGVEAIAAGIIVFGDNAWGWRAPSAIAGTLVIALVYPLGRRLRLPPAWALAATMLAAGDMLLILQSRLAMLDIFVALGSAACVYLALRAAQAQPSRFALWVALCGLAGGAATACKWSGCLSVVAAILVLTLGCRRPSGRRVASAAAGIVALTVAVYVVTYAPYFVAGHSLGQWLRLQRFMVSYNWKARETPAQSSLAMTWPFDIHPIWYHWGRLGSGLSRGLLAVGNPLLWWASIVAFVVLGVQAVTRRDPRLAAAPLLVAVLYLPWLATSRPAFLYYMTPVVPFMAILVASALWRLATPPPGDRRPAATAYAGGSLLASRGGGPRRPALMSALAWAYVGATLGVTLAFLPFVLGYPVTADYYRYLMWLPTWW